MMKLIKLMMFAIVVFAMSAGGSWFARSRQQAAGTATDAHGGESNTAAAAGATEHGVEIPATADAPAADGAGEELPVVVRPRMLTPEDILRNAMSLKAAEEKLTKREQEAEQENLRLELVQSDLQSEQQSIEHLATDVKEQIAAANLLLNRILDEKATWDAERQRGADEMKKFQEARTSINAAEEQNIKQLSTWIQGMDEQAAANFITELSNNGKMDVAVQLLANFEEREASKILAALNNPKMMAELADKFRTLQRPTKTASKKK